MSKHSIYSPSKLSRILKCPGSVQLEMKVNPPNTQSSYAQEGTMLHDVTEQHLNLGLFEVDDSLADVAELTTEQKSAVQDCLYYAQKFTGITNEYVTERRVHLTVAHHKLKDCHGTADLIVYNSTDRILHVIDWKFGKGVEVNVENNSQLKAYGLGAYLEAHSIWPNMTDVIQKIEVHVVQPRLYNFQSLSYEAAELLDWSKRQLVPAIENAESQDPHFEAGDEQCRWCPVKQECGIRHEYANEVAQEIFKQHAIVEEGDAVPQHAIENLLKDEAFFVSYLKDCRKKLQDGLTTGQIESNMFKLVAGRSIRRWVDDEKVGAYLVNRFDPEKIFKTKLISPAQAEKMLTPDERRSEDFQELWEKPAGKVSMVPMSDRRKPIESPANEAFKDYVE